jgi:hypothetical protein
MSEEPKKGTIFTCANCRNETKVTFGGRTSLVCQSCGCFDIKFDADVLLASANSGNIDVENAQAVMKGEPFYGNTKNGFVWFILEAKPPIEEPKTEEVEEKKEPKKSSSPKSFDKKEKKPTDLIQRKK